MVSNINNIIAGNIKISNYEPINLTKSNCKSSDGLISLYSEGPPFIPTPNTFDWRQLEIDFDKFKNTLRKISFFFSINEAGSNTNKNTTLPLTIDNPPQKQSLWIPPKSNSNEIETFISLVEKDLFQDTSRKRIPSNFSEDEKKALKDRRKMDYLMQTWTRLCIYKTRGIVSLLLIKKQIIKKARSRLKGVPF